MLYVKYQKSSALRNIFQVELVRIVGDLMDSSVRAQLKAKRGNRVANNMNKS